MNLDPTTRARLLQHARSAITAYLTGREAPAPSDWPEDLPRCGVFVTLHKLDRLRGCIGVFSADDPLPETIARMAVAAATDPRFRDTPLGSSEMKDVRIDISLLSPLERISNPLDFELGRHGIYVKDGRHVGCFLPEVATEHGWSKETFLAQCCSHKAGLKQGAWNEPGTEVFRFTVDKISDRA